MRSARPGRPDRAWPCGPAAPAPGPAPRARRRARPVLRARAAPAGGRCPCPWASAGSPATRLRTGCPGRGRRAEWGSLSWGVLGGLWGSVAAAVAAWAALAHHRDADGGRARRRHGERGGHATQVHVPVLHAGDGGDVLAVAEEQQRGPALRAVAARHRVLVVARHHSDLEAVGETLHELGQHRRHVLAFGETHRVAAL